MRLVFASHGYVSGQTVIFKIYDSNQNLISNQLGTEWANTGNYYIDVSLVPTELYLVVAEEQTGAWRGSRYIIGGVDIGDYVNNITLDFGKYHFYASDEVVSSTSSNIYQRKMRLTTGEVPVGVYRIGWFFLYNHSSISYSFQARCQLNESITLIETSVEIKDTSNWVMASGFKYENLTEGIQTIDLEFRTTNGISFIKDARLEFWKV
jgi:hypothetical protein